MKILTYLGLSVLGITTLSPGKACDGSIFGQKNNPFLSPHRDTPFLLQGMRNVSPFMNLPTICEDEEREPSTGSTPLVVTPKLAEDLKKLKLDIETLNIRFSPSQDYKKRGENRSFQFPTEKLNELMAQIIAEVMAKEKPPVLAFSPPLVARQKGNPFHQHLVVKQGRNPFLNPGDKN